MTLIDTILRINPELKGVVSKIPSLEEYRKMQADWYNSSVGYLNEEDGINCDICRNKGYIRLADENETVKECSCMAERRTVRNMAKSGLGDLLRLNFDNYTTVEEWQIKAKKMAENYAKSADSNEWLYIGGQSGAGKTHLCTAVCREFMKKGRTVKYMLWGSINQKLCACKYREEEFEEFMDSLRKADILYIDDFLKSDYDENGNPKRPPQEEMKNAFTLINARYFAGKKTIISSEYFLYEFESYDPATAGRIKEKTSCLIQFKRDSSKNYRRK